MGIMEQEEPGGMGGGWEGKVKDRVWREITNTEDL